MSDGKDDKPELEREIEAEIVAGTNPANPLRQWVSHRRSWARQHPRFRVAYLTLVALVGVLVAATGLVLVPLPGPGWLIVFLGLAILGTEFHWARKLTGWVKRQLDRFWTWWNRRKSRPKP